SPGKGPEGIPPSPLRGFGGQDGGQPSRGWQLSERNGASGEARAECSEPKRGAGGKSARSADPLAPKLEAPPGFEPGMEVLQSHPRVAFVRSTIRAITPEAFYAPSDASIMRSR